MAPIPPKLTPDATSLRSTLDRRLRFLKDERIPELRDCTGPSLVAQQVLAEEVREEVGVFAREVENLSMMVDDQFGERARMEVQGLVDGYTNELHELRAQTRNAILTSKKSIDAAERTSNRAQLFAPSSSSFQPPSSKPPQNLAEASSALTTALQRTVISLQAELETSVLSTQLLSTSTSTLAAVSNQHSSLSSTMLTSKHLLTALEKADWIDRLLLFAGLGFFVCVVLFILKERFVDRGVRMVFWWWRFVPDFWGDEALLREGSVQSRVVESISSVASVASVVSTAVVAATAAAGKRQNSAGDVLESEKLSTVLTSILPSESDSVPIPLPRTPIDHVEL